MFEINKIYKFKIKNPESEKGFAFYTGTIIEIKENLIFIKTIRDENLSINMREILKSKEE